MDVAWVMERLSVLREAIYKGTVDVDWRLVSLRFGEEM